MERHGVDESSSSDSKAAAKEAGKLEDLSKHGSNKALEEAAELLSKSTNGGYLKQLEKDLNSYDSAHENLPQLALYDSEINPMNMQQSGPAQKDFREADLVVRHTVQTPDGPDQTTDWATGDTYENKAGKQVTTGSFQTWSALLDQPPAQPSQLLSALKNGA